MNRIIQIKIFNNILDDLFDYLEDTFPYFKSDIMLTRTTTHLIRSSNPRLVVEQFMEYVGPYSSRIFNCDEDFFLNFEKDQSMQDSLSRDNLLFGMKLRNIWIASETTDMQKASVFLFFQKLLKAGEKCLL
jgi:hypothetical protein